MSSSISISKSESSKLLKTSVNIWFVVVVIGQFIFALYILGLYGVSGLAGDFERWNAASPMVMCRKMFGVIYSSEYIWPQLL